jgi:hypothetical protein
MISFDKMSLQINTCIQQVHIYISGNYTKVNLNFSLTFIEVIL